MKGSLQPVAARLVLSDLKSQFKESGGTYVVTQDFQPVVAGWWWNKERSRIDEDPHVLVAVDVPHGSGQEEEAPIKHLSEMEGFLFFQKIHSA